MPVHQNLLCRTEAEALAVRRGDLNLSECPACGLVCNASFDPALLSYQGGYDSDQSFSRTFEQHVEGLVERLVAAGVAGCRVVEVGCGSGYFLRRLCAAGDCQGEGYDPGYSGPLHDPSSGARFVRGLYEPPSSEAPPQAVICRHVIEHVPRPVDFLAGLTAGMGSSTHLYFETPALEWIVENAAVWDLFYEHCNYFTEAALSNVSGQAGLGVRSLERVFGGQYFWLEARGEGTVEAPVHPGREVLGGFARSCGRVEGALRDQLEQLSRRGRVALWGAAAKGASYASLLDPERRRIRCLIDVNPARQGRFVPGSGHPIVEPADATELGVTDAIVMNPNYEEEIRAIVRRMGASLELHRAGGP